jgi:hypothetical protein
MKNIWIRFGCFLTGYNYNIIKSSSEAAAKSVKKYTAAMVIVGILWFFIGFTFSQRYIQSGLTGSILAGVISIIIIVQIERQIILSGHRNGLITASRICLAVMMAILGAVIIDQILFEKDIELEKISYISERVDSLLPSKTFELKNQINTLDTTIQQKEMEKQRYDAEIKENPMIPITSIQTKTTSEPVKRPDSNGKDSITFEQKQTKTVLRTNIPNPKISLVGRLDTTITEMRKQMAEKQQALLTIRPSL